MGTFLKIHILSNEYTPLRIEMKCLTDFQPQSDEAPPSN